jgi:hypothetical protein
MTDNDFLQEVDGSHEGYYPQMPSEKEQAQRLASEGLLEPVVKHFPGESSQTFYRLTSEGKKRVPRYRLHNNWFAWTAQFFAPRRFASMAAVETIPLPLVAQFTMLTWVRSRLHPMLDVARTLKRRFENIITYLRHRITNATSESINAKIQWVKYTARGYRNKQNFIHAIYFHCGGLDLAPEATK